MSAKVPRGQKDRRALYALVRLWTLMQGHASRQKRAVPEKFQMHMNENTQQR